MIVELATLRDRKKIKLKDLLSREEMHRRWRPMVKWAKEGDFKIPNICIGWKMKGRF